MDDNRVMMAFDTLAPDEQKAALQRWGSEKAWYLCKYTTTIETGVRDGYDLSELATHYSIPLASVKLCAENYVATKGKGVMPARREEVSFNNDLPPGAVQGPIIVPDTESKTPEPVQEEPRKKRGRRKKDENSESEPRTPGAVPVDPSSYLHPDAVVVGVVEGVVPAPESKAVVSGVKGADESPLHPNAQVNPTGDSASPSKVRKGEKSQSFKVFGRS